MDRFNSFVVEEDIVAALPLCVRRLRGPGRARRLPLGSAYRAAGATLHRVLLYSEDGQARVQVVRSDGLGTPKESPGGRLSSVSPVPAAGGSSASIGATASTPTATTATPAAATAMMRSAGVSGAGLVAEALEEGMNPSRSTHLSNQDADAVHAKNQLRRARAATLAAETERRYEEAQESSLAGLLQALPLLRVVPPLSLQQQVYTREAPPPASVPPTTAAAAAANASGCTREAAAPGSIASTAATGGVPDQKSIGGASTALFRATQARYGASWGDNGAKDGVPSAKSVIRDGRGLGLSAAVLLSKEEMEAREAQEPTPAPPSPPSAAADRQPPPPLLASSLTPPSLSPPSTAATTPPPPPLLEDEKETPTTDTTLNGLFIDGGLAVTIRLGTSCDEPNSLRYVTWGGCKPVLLRAVVWRLLSDCAPTQVARQRAELQRKRRQYEGYTRQYCSALTMLAVSEPATTAAAGSPPLPSLAAKAGSQAAGNGVSSPNRDLGSLSRLPALPRPGNNPNGAGNANAAVSSLAPHERAIIHQMLLDLPRHQSPVFHARRSVAGMARCLFLWSQRHPAVGYVQGMDDVVAIFYQVFLTDALRQHAREQLARHGRASTSSARNTAADLESSRYGTAARGEDVDAAEVEDSERSTLDVIRLLLVSLHPHRSATAGSAPSTPNSTAQSLPSLPRAAHNATSVADTPTTATVAAAAEGVAEASPPLSPFLTEADMDVYFRTPAALDAALAELPESYLTQVEADTFLCAGRVLSFLQDNFMTGQPGILRNVRRLEALTQVVDPAVVTFLESYGLTVMDGCFQWLHCLLARELPLSLLLRLWDCYLAIGVGGDRPLSVGASLGAGSGAGGNFGGGGGGMGSASSDEAIMYFHVCVCCALLRALHTSLTGGTVGVPSSAAPATTASTSVMGGWAAALVTALPGFRSRTPQNAVDESGGAAGSRGGPSIDVVMTTLKRPFDALFPNYPSTAVKQRLLDVALQEQQQLHLSGIAARGATARQPSPPAESTEEVAAERWLDLLIADAYCIWRLHPLSS